MKSTHYLLCNSELPVKTLYEKLFVQTLYKNNQPKKLNVNGNDKSTYFIIKKQKGSKKLLLRQTKQ